MPQIPKPMLGWIEAPPWPVARSWRETRDTVTLDLTPPGAFSFLPGQFNMLSLPGIGEVPISVSGDPRTSGHVLHTIRDVGAVTHALCAMRPGEEARVRGPYGTHWPVDTAAGGDLVITARSARSSCAGMVQCSATGRWPAGSASGSCDGLFRTAGPSHPRKPALAVWKFASCDGCQLTLLNCEDELLAMAASVNIASFPEASSEVIDGPYDLSLVEGSITTRADAERIRRIREASRLLVTIGACATSGGIQALRTSTPIADHVRSTSSFGAAPSTAGNSSR